MKIKVFTAWAAKSKKQNHIDQLWPSAMSGPYYHISPSEKKTKEFVDKNKDSYELVQVEIKEI